MFNRLRTGLLAGAALAAMGLAGGSTSALALPITVTANTATLTNALIGAGSGITVINRSLIGAATQQGIYSGFNLAPSTGTGPTLTLGNGVVLTSGTANLPATNTTNQFNPVFPGTGSYAPLSTLAGASTFDSNVLNYTFSVASTLNAVTAQFVFGTDEFPTQTVTDIFGFLVDGVNYAKFPNGQLISNTPGNPTNFINNPVGSGLYKIEYNGLTPVFTVTGLLNPNLSTHTLQIAIADTSDNIYDSGVFITGLKATTTTGGGGIGPITPVPEPASLGIFGLGIAATAMAHRLRRRRNAA